MARSITIAHLCITSFQIFSRDWKKFTAVLAVDMGLSFAFSKTAAMVYGQFKDSINPEVGLTGIPADTPVAVGIIILLKVVTLFMVNAIICYGLVRTFRGRPFNIGECLNYIAERFATVVLIGLLTILLWVVFVFGCVLAALHVLENIVNLSLEAMTPSIPWVAVVTPAAFFIILFSGLTLCAALVENTGVVAAARRAAVIFFHSGAWWRFPSALAGYGLPLLLIVVFVPRGAAAGQILGLTVFHWVMLFAAPTLYCVYAGRESTLEGAAAAESPGRPDEPTGRKLPGFGGETDLDSILRGRPAALPPDITEREPDDPPDGSRHHILR
ncbi:MAG: hypothetical protein LBR29_11040 [Methylobacteriaceae bacterium]|nr:hypothetical protein [Methylobacteriaceae bacterium]